MKNNYMKPFRMILLLLAGCCAVSCTDYLDKAPESDVSAEEAFKNFRNFQGFIEEIYNCIPDKEKCNWCPSWNWGDDEIFNPEADNRMTHQVDLGNFRAWQTTGNWLYKSGSSPTSGDKFSHSLWPHAWYCIRKANLGIENLDKFVGSQEERNLIEGQLYFFRAWWHFELMAWFGGLPYVDRALNSAVEEDLRLPRLSYQECADKAAADFRHAADLLPIDWDKTAPGAATVNKNSLRVNKITALGYLGKNYLWAASPLMKNGAQVGGGKTYDYDAAYAGKAAAAFKELLDLVESGQTQYALAEYNYSDIYNHTPDPSASSRFADIFYTRRQNWAQPGTVEAIFRGPSPDYNGSNWNTTKVFGPKVNGLVEHDNVIHQPTANLIEAYGMANGLPITDPESGFDKTHPFKDRDPRFYHDIVFDGFKFVNGTIDVEADEPLRYCSLYTGGAMRPIENGSRTGYFIQKLVPHTCNKYDGEYNWGSNLHTYLPYMRLGDIYLMYAEASAAAGDAASAVKAVNTIRQRCGAGDLGAAYQSGSKLMDEIRRERAVELAFEGMRFNDLQRWLLLTEPAYTTKYSHEFDRVETDDWFTKNDPRDARVANFRREPILTRNFDAKHYWFPLPNDDTYIYLEFNQNPGW